MARVETHLASCASCQEVLAVLARTEPSPAGPSSMWERVVSGFKQFGSRPQWAIPIAAAATAAAIWVATPKDRGVDEFERTIAPAISESARPEPSAPASAAAPPVAREEKEAALSEAASRDTASRKAASEATSEAKQRRDEAPAPPQDRAANERVADAVSSARAAETKELDQDRKAEAPRAAEGRQAAAAAAAPAAPAPAQEDSRQRAEVQSGLLRQAPATEAVSPDPLVRWRILSARRLERSTNGGKTWEPVQFPQPIDLTAVRAPSATSAIVTAADGRQFRTEDAGKTWNPVQP